MLPVVYLLFFSIFNILYKYNISNTDVQVVVLVSFLSFIEEMFGLFRIYFYLYWSSRIKLYIWILLLSLKQQSATLTDPCL